MRIKPSNNNGSILIRFTRNKTKYTLSNLGQFSDRKSIDTATLICERIASDIAIGLFTASNSEELFTKYHPEAKLREAAILRSQKQDALTLAREKLETLDFGTDGFKTIIALLERYKKPVTDLQSAQSFINWLSDGTRKPQSINRYLNILKPTCPMFRDIKRLKAQQPEDEEPFSFEEIAKIMRTFENDYPHYADFVRFLFSTGCRPNEATAVKFSALNKQRKTITISCAIARDKTGKKTEKNTKTNTSRTFPISDSLYTVLCIRSETTWLDRTSELMFTSPRGHIIDVNDFAKNYWKPALVKADVEYRCLYNTRHTFISHYIEKYKDYQKCAAITHGTKSGVQTIINHYSHLVSEISTLDLFG